MSVRRLTKSQPRFCALASGGKSPKPSAALGTFKVREARVHALAKLNWASCKTFSK
ncbi:MAG: hypothetical protein ACKERG_00240 [Candidatus Hodgkinia cicadicola]